MVGKSECLVVLCLLLMLSRNLGSSSSRVCCSLEREAPEQVRVLALLRHPFPLQAEALFGFCLLTLYLCEVHLFLQDAFSPSLEHRTMEWFALEGALKTIQFHPLLWAGAASTRAGCSLPCLNQC